MKKSIIAVSIATLALTGCFESKTDTDTAPIVPVSSVPAPVAVNVNNNGGVTLTQAQFDSLMAAANKPAPVAAPVAAPKPVTRHVQHKVEPRFEIRRVCEQKPVTVSVDVPDEAKPQDRSAMGMAGGALIGGLLGTQVGGGNGKTAATLLGAVAGAYAGDKLANPEEPKTKPTTHKEQRTSQVEVCRDERVQVN